MHKPIYKVRFKKGMFILCNTYKSDYAECTESMMIIHPQLNTFCDHSLIKVEPRARCPAGYINCIHSLLHVRSV